jgi:hypothetical protein
MLDLAAEKNTMHVQAFCQCRNAFCHVSAQNLPIVKCVKGLSKARGWMTPRLTPTLLIGDLMFELDHGLRQESVDARLHAGLPAREASEAASR